MNLLEKGNNSLKKLFLDTSNTFFGRTIEDILASNFFDSFEADILEQPDLYRLFIRVTGITRDEITINVDGRVMWVTARRKVERGSWKSIEFSKHIRRSFVLPFDADANNIKAKCKSGLLTINIGKTKPKDAHRIIQISGEESGATKPARLSAWWIELFDKAQRLLPGRPLKNGI